MFGVTILGNNSAQPAYGRHPAAQIVTLNQHQFLIDCGEGTQMQMAQYKIRHSRIQYILISHLHGDHYFGLPGLLNTMALAGRTQDLYLFGPQELMYILDQIFKSAGTELPFKLVFKPIVEAGLLHDTQQFSISCFTSFHRISCYGFIIREKRRPRRLDIEKATAYKIPNRAFEKLTNGEDVINEVGEKIENNLVTKPGYCTRSYAYSADTCYNELIAAAVKGVTLLYHETTYLKNETERALIRYHSTTEDAAKIAKMAAVSSLIIGHFSSKYQELHLFLEETKAIFPNAALALEGATYLVSNDFDDDKVK